ncbi:cap-specific mRNA (nucleoside-2'-O-)-methyltransferase 1-like isoform X1 [Brienomyrus brachyistius]|uniref:cap-specific mRNA (nucleoside-2'-O-)-methyltransferase 1 isoform X1 n=1 Tax=Brienomyrus brachyistius TaxID=42636 RepID=UPI0020B21937|nr:cap-specific mRNA (nucleoside-2'-O-)-methyltransferase 1 isoform X1 [Brienomyrus brachyistius]XP_048830227.1 cap-specific mRNA (nucleoside-2'-O-)-methyltransferase 1 isoform X1 [Brienomyrus brachyistius]XP_048830228.1 cap-specific mRNA (nucleoside-2'-O-)-methyltransferase 1 isoform X1 [Brienomyrus brachyistius]XP_048830239.1 cap-specific mRNA (nucleoside-2'-O-)-methyltransferase 1-like isoform X1 [Brienomyrus brachyistius]XP_048830240.1 cap-specific mRNA (nucleoside-2'-O-)-methyltransferase 
MKRRVEQVDHLKKKKKRLDDSSFDEYDDEKSFISSSQDSSQSDSHSDAEEQKPLKPSPSHHGSQSESSQETSSNKFSMYNSVSQKLMAKMGFREGEGLGKFGQGRREIVEASTQRGRRGLGLTLKGFQGELNVDWQDEPEPSAVEEVTWFPESSTEMPDAEELADWMTTGERKLKIDDETEFCSEDLLHSLLRCKSIFDDLEGEEMRRARTRSNPYETIRGGIFLNRAAMKMANIDHVFDNMFTNPKDSQRKPCTRDKEGELLYFGDVCAGPGGFSEYVLWRRRWHAKGFGMTLRGPNDFKLEDFFAAPSELFEPYYGEGGIDGDGDITRPENITAFRNFVMESTDRRGLHFLMADGGFSVEGQENIQEILSKQLLLCQFLTALSTVRTGGHFICKTFDLFTPFSVGMIYLLYLCFERVSLFKPITSRPANSERYVVCRGLKPGSDPVREYLFTINLKLNQLRDKELDVNEVVPLDIIKGDTDFFNYMIVSNEKHCAVQIKALAKIHAYVRDSTLSEGRQADIRKQCLSLWGIPDKARVAPSSTDPRSKFQELMQGTDIESFNYKPTQLTVSTLEKVHHVLDYRCMVGGGNRLFLLGMGRSQIYTWDGKIPLRWKKLENFNLELPRDTLLSVEIVQELKGEGKAQRRINAVHVMDALVLNGTDVRDQHFNQRIQMAEKFVRAVSKPSRPDMYPIRVKEVYRLEEMEKIFIRLEMKVTKSSGGVPRLSYTGRDDRHFLPSGLYIIKTVNEPWTMAYSKNTKRKFFYNKLTKDSSYDLPENSAAPFHVCHSEQLFWAWEEGVKVHDSQTRVDPEKLSKDNVLAFIRQHYQH